MIVDVVLMAALSEEHKAAQKVLRGIANAPPYKHSGHKSDFDVYTLPKGSSVVLTQPTSMGQLNAAAATGNLLHDLKPKIILLCGIAGCMRKQSDDWVTLGDVIVSDPIIDYEFERILEESNENPQVHYPACADLIRLIKASNWPHEGNLLPQRPDGSNVKPRVYTGPVFSGNQVIANATAKDAMLKRMPNAIGIEMEAAGIAAVLKEMWIPERILTVKACMDWADGTRNDKWRQYACDVSAEFIGFLLQNIIPDYLSALAKHEDPAIAHQQLFKNRIKYAFSSFLGAQAPAMPFVEQMAAGLRDQAIDETTALVALTQNANKRYSAQIGTGHQFLLRARPIFSNANRIVATSVDTVSTFWTDPNNRGNALEYIGAHGTVPERTESIMRLFIFSTPESAHNHSRILDRHVERFPNTFLCSSQAYEHHLKTIAPTARDKYLHRDFAILETDNSKYFADLDSERFQIAKARFADASAEVDCNATLALFNQFATTEQGQFHPFLKVLKWQFRHWDNKARWTEHLTKMFGEPTADVFHIVAFSATSNEYSDLKHTLADIKHRILSGPSDDKPSLALRYGIRDIWIAKQIRHENIHIAQIAKASLAYEPHPTMDYILLMRFADNAKLEKFMVDPEHLAMRLDLFGQFKGPMKDLMREFEISTENLTRQGGRGKLLYECMELLATNHMRRYDFREDELISEIVQLPPPPLQGT